MAKDQTWFDPRSSVGALLSESNDKGIEASSTESFACLLIGSLMLLIHSLAALFTWLAHSTVLIFSLACSLLEMCFGL